MSNQPVATLPFKTREGDIVNIVDLSLTFSDSPKYIPVEPQLRTDKKTFARRTKI